MTKKDVMEFLTGFCWLGWTFFVLAIAAGKYNDWKLDRVLITLGVWVLVIHIPMETYFKDK